MGSADLRPRPRAPPHARVPCVRRFVRGRGVRPRQGVPHAGGPPALRVRARLRGAPGAPAGLRLRRRHLPRRVRAARRALPRPPGPARHVPGTLPQYVGAGAGPTNQTPERAPLDWVSCGVGMRKSGVGFWKGRSGAHVG